MFFVIIILACFPTVGIATLFDDCLVGNVHKLMLTGLGWDNAGRYTAIATNKHGHIESDCMVKISTKPSGRCLLIDRQWQVVVTC